MPNSSPNGVKFPYLVGGRVVTGFGRGSKELGCPTANLEADTVALVDLPDGVYYGFAQLEVNHEEGESWVSKVFMMCSSLGLNPHFGNDNKSLEVHVLNNFGFDFYGASLRVAICGYIRGQLKFTSLQELIEAIQSDLQLTRQILGDENKWSEVKGNNFFLPPSPPSLPPPLPSAPSTCS